MGKAGNRLRREAKRLREVERHASLDENIQQILKEDEWKKSVMESAPTKEEYEDNMATILGPPGPPKADNVVWLGLPTPQKKPTRKVVDCLGRVIEVEEEIPPILRNPMSMSTGTLSLPGPKRRVTLMRDHELQYPELWLEVFVQPDPAVFDDEARFAKMFSRARCSRAKSVLEADLVVFGGGSDVDPLLYGETPHMTTCCDPKRDEDDMNLYLMCLEHGIPMLGICRGAQFLHVMNGGKLYQDIDNHYGDHRIYDIRSKDFIHKVSSVHHQACRYNRDGGMEIIATNGDARKRAINATERNDGPKADVEVFFYRESCCLGVQGHPEYKGYQAFTKYVLDLINETIICSPDIEWVDGQRRIKKELLEERKLIVANRTPSIITELKGL